MVIQKNIGPDGSVYAAGADLTASAPANSCPVACTGAVLNSEGPCRSTAGAYLKVKCPDGLLQSMDGFLAAQAASSDACPCAT